MRWFAVCVAILLTGCATTRQVTISAKPADATISIDGVPRGTGPVTEKLNFQSDADIHHVSASRPGYQDQVVDVTSSYDQPDLLIELQPKSKRVTIRVLPVPAIISVDGRPVSNQPVGTTTVTLPFTVDASNQWTSHLIAARHAGYRPATQPVTWQDTTQLYTLNLEPLRKDLNITTTPDGAEVFINGQSLGKSPISYSGFAFPVDPDTGKFEEQTLKATKPGFDPVERQISWDNGKTEYHIELPPKSKVVKIRTDPPGGTVEIDHQTLPKDESGASVMKLSFPPLDEQGKLKTYTATVSKKTAESEWIPQELTIGWDEGKSDYQATLKEVKTRPVALLGWKAVRTDDGWQLEPRTATTLAMKDVSEPNKSEPPTRITNLPRGTMLDSVTLSPDGQWLLLTVLQGKGKNDLRSQMQMVKSDGSGGANILSDGKSLDLSPSFWPDGSQIVFSSNRAGRKLSVWQMSATGEPGVTQLTSGDTTDLWPTVDSDPKPRLFYEALVDSRSDPRLYETRLGTTTRTDLTQLGGEQPRVSPKADAVVFTMSNEKTGKREIYKMSDHGGGIVNLTNQPEFDCFDPVWSNDGSRIAFVSDRGADEDGRNNYDIWVIELAHPDKPIRVTSNGSWDDSPAWDPGGKYIYFRSNRGGSWQVWKAAVK